MQDNEKKPALRFKGFTDPWEQRKVGDHLIPSKLPGHTGVDARKLTVKLWGKGVVEKTDSYGGSEHTQYYVRHAGQFMYGKLDFLHAAFGIVPAELDNYESTLDSPAFDLSEINGKFLVSRVCKEDFYLKYGTIANGSRKAKRIHEDTFMDMPILVPELEEQERVAALLEALDTLITLHQRKYEKLVNIKKSMLDKMFPQNGVSVPEIRFKGFTDPWEQRKFSELYEKVSRKNDLTYGKDDIISVANMYYKAESYITDENYLLTYNVFEMGDIAFEGNKSKNFAHGRFVENTIGNGIVSHVFDVFKPRMTNYDLQFWKYAINNERIMGPILLRSTKASTMMTNLVADDFLQENFLIPCYEEQKKIGEFLNQLDTLITLHQRKLEKLQNIKKSCLEKMFV